MISETVATCAGERRMSAPARSAMVFAFAAIAGCAGAGSDGRLAATQRAMNQSPALNVGLPAKKVCDIAVYGVTADAYVGLPGANVGPRVPEYRGIPSRQQTVHPEPYCRSISWSGNNVGNVHEASLGRYIVEKIGPDQSAMGMTYAPFRARFEPSQIGSVLIARRIHSAPRSALEGSVSFSKDADDKLRADILP